MTWEMWAMFACIALLGVVLAIVLTVQVLHRDDIHYLTIAQANTNRALTALHDFNTVTHPMTDDTRDGDTHEPLN